MTSATAITLAVLATIAGAGGALFFKLGAQELAFSIRRLIRAYKLMIAVILYGLGSVFFILALSIKGSELSILYPIISLSYVWIALISKRFLQEELNMHKWIGIALIMAGVMFIGVGS